MDPTGQLVVWYWIGRRFHGHRVSRARGVAGTQVTITGFGFGATQSNGIWLGTVGAVVSWSDTRLPPQPPATTSWNLVGPDLRAAFPG